MNPRYVLVDEVDPPDAHAAHNPSPAPPSAQSQLVNANGTSVHQHSSNSTSIDPLAASRLRRPLSPFNGAAGHSDDDNDDADRNPLLPELHPWRQSLVFDGGEMRATVRLYHVSRLAYTTYVFSCLASIGFAALFSYWLPHVWLKLFGRAVHQIDDSSVFGNCRSTQPGSLPLWSSHGKTWALVSNSWGEISVLPIQAEPFHGAASNVFCTGLEESNLQQSLLFQLVFIEYRLLRLYWHPFLQRFMSTDNWKDVSWSETSHADSTHPGAARSCSIASMSNATALERRQVFGSNSVVIPERSTFDLILHEILHPFSVFQALSILLWCLDDYFYYAAAIFLITVASSIDTLRQTKQNLKRLRNIGENAGFCNVQRAGQWLRLPFEEIVPGDLIQLSTAESHLVPCDALLLSGDVIVDESILSGESMPINKSSSIPPSALCQVDLAEPQLPPQIAKSFVYSGTRLIRARGQSAGRSDCGAAVALAVRTAFSTTKGALIRSMLHPRPHESTLYRDAFRFLRLMTAFALIGFVFTLYVMLQHQVSAKVILLRALDLVTIVVPPALPASLSVGVSFAIHRLRNQALYCSSPSHVNQAGQVQAAVFDKTGTLTVAGLTVLGVQLPDPQGMSMGSTLVTDVARLDQQGRLMHALATCHKVSVLDNGDLIGDPLDVEMVTWAAWSLRDTPGVGVCAKPRDSTQESDGVALIRSFEFVPQLRRMSVITRQLDKSFVVYCKGAPEAMRSICKPESIPLDYESAFHELAHRGYRVLAVATKSLTGFNIVKVTRMGRDAVECDLEFLGFLVFENKLKPGSRTTIETLRSAGISTMMCTGDNLLTAISVSRECCLVDRLDVIFFPTFCEHSPSSAPNLSTESRLVWRSFDESQHQIDPLTLLPTSPNCPPYHLALTGDFFNWILDNCDQTYIDQVLYKTQVFARMNPDQKQWLIEKLQGLGYCVAFVGDGANDCGALRAADVGLSLSEAEASVAAPFTSAQHEVKCVIDLIREGRCAISTSFSCFCFMAIYSLVQFTSVTLLYTVASNLGDFQFLYFDLLVIMPLAVTAARSKAYPTLAQKRPPNQLLSKPIVVSLITTILLQLAFQIFAFMLVHEKDVVCFENTVTFYISSFQYVFAAISFATGPPFRISMWKNTSFIVCAICLLCSNFALLTMAPLWLLQLFDLVIVPWAFQLQIVAISCVYAAATWLVGQHVNGLIVNAWTWIERQRVHSGELVRFKQLERFYGA
ncbi:hypothetical protein BCR44DRAFT_1444158 [Catenaria anguillulae PL171]|uniref:Cation-transporting ATPase n=1 Tax=Catenaria anguillulae PL171 TaxID=765915 RepID=A0A1Y2H7W9_9FUNG|nr:hypothetical protein BCR44DRAFT_1444158 [Catenaria anguillulae PL171]